MSEEAFKKVKNKVITTALDTLRSVTRKSDLNRDNRLKAVDPLKEARDNRDKIVGYKKYLEVIELSKGDQSIITALKSIKGEKEQILA